MSTTGWFALTLRIHRPEIVALGASVILASVVLGGAWVHISSVAPADACWIELFAADGSPDPSRPCLQAYVAFEETQRATLLIARPISGLLTWLVGLVLGVSVVGGELETGTAGLAWALSGRRLRWLAMRSVPLIAVSLGLLSMVAALSHRLWEAAFPWTELGAGRLPALVALGFEGPTLVAAGAAAFGVGLLLGTLTGRTMPALALGAVLGLGLGLALGPGLQSLVAHEVAEWAPRGDGPQESYSLIELESGYREADGPILDYDEAEALAEERCPSCADEDVDWIYENLEPWTRSAPLGSFPAFEAAHLVAGLGVGVVGLVATLPLVAWRRPRA